MLMHVFCGLPVFPSTVCFEPGELSSANIARTCRPDMYMYICVYNLNNARSVTAGART